MQDDERVLAPREELPSEEFMLKHPKEFGQIWELLVDRTLLREEVEKLTRELKNTRKEMHEIVAAQIAYLDPEVKK